jgi:DNA invertase Pin-like site-specific DNA recombinase
MKLGYARVSTDDQSLDVQVTQLRAASCEYIFREKASGKTSDRPELHAVLESIATGQHPNGFEWLSVQHRPRNGEPRGTGLTLVVTKLDRLARSTRDLLEIVDQLNKAGAGLVSLGEPWADTTSPAGRMVMTVLAGVAEFERERILERTSEGRAHAKKNGVRFGRPQSLSKEQQRAALKMLKDAPVREVARVFKVCPKTIRRMKTQQGSI